MEAKTATEVSVFMKKLGEFAVRNVDDELWSGLSNPSSTSLAATTLSIYFWLGLNAADKTIVAKSLASKVNFIRLQRTGACNYL